MSVDWSDRAVSAAMHLNPYVPGKPVERLLAEKGLREAVKLASNENPFGPSPAAVAAVRRAAADMHRYPDGDATALKERLAARHGVRPENILAGNGSNEVLELVIRAFAGPGDEVVFSGRGFIVYRLAATAAGATPVAVPETDGFTHDLDGMARAVGPQTKVVCVANPNNPTGTLHGVDAVQTFLDALPRDVVVVLDEAYHEYVARETGDTIAHLRHPGLVVCRTFSKAWGLAGLRAGYAVADAGLLAVVNRFREPFNVSALAQAAALAALDDVTWMEEVVARTLAGRARMEARLDEMGLLALRGHGNFVLLHHARAADVAAMLEDEGVIPRPLGPYGMREYLRVTVGTPEENARFLDALSRAMERL